MLCQILNVDLSDDQWEQASLPVKWGGLGIRKACQVASSAFLASATGASTLVSTILPHRFRMRVAHDHSIDRAMDHWMSLGGITPPPAQEAGLQKLCDIQIIKVTASRLLSQALDDYCKARLLAVSAPHAGDWLNAPPISAVGLRFSN